jgi:hypothetical protein
MFPCSSSSYSIAIAGLQPKRLAVSDGGACGPILYTLFMNKRAKKRLKEAIAKDKAERTKTYQDPNPSAPKEPGNTKGFLPKPAKKRG